MLQTHIAILAGDGCPDAELVDRFMESLKFDKNVGTRIRDKSETMVVVRGDRVAAPLFRLGESGPQECRTRWRERHRRARRAPMPNGTAPNTGRVGRRWPWPGRVPGRRGGAPRPEAWHWRTPRRARYERWLGQPGHRSFRNDRWQPGQQTMPRRCRRIAFCAPLPRRVLWLQAQHHERRGHRRLPVPQAPHHRGGVRACAPIQTQQVALGHRRLVTWFRWQGSANDRCLVQMTLTIGIGIVRSDLTWGLILAVFQTRRCSRHELCPAVWPAIDQWCAGR
jgi:hypothetical protein